MSLKKLQPCCVKILFFLLRRGKFEEAVKLLDKALEEEKEEAGLYVNRGGE